MSYTVGDLVNASNVQTDLDMMFANTPDPVMKQKVPFLEYLLMPGNRGNLAQSITIGNGQVRTVEVQYMQEFDEALVASNVTNPTCTAASFAPPNNSQEYTIDTSVNRSISFKVTRAVLETAKVTPSEYMSQSLLRAIAALEVAVDKQCADSAVLQYGEWSTDANDWATQSPDVAITNDELVIKTRKDSSVDPYPYTAQNLAYAAEYCGYTQAPMIFSGTLLRDWVSLGGNFAAADSGLDLQGLYSKYVDQYGFAVTYSDKIAAALGGQTKFLMVQPGALQLAIFTASDWTANSIYQELAANYYKTVIFSPRTGLPMDLVMTDDCGTISVRLFATTKVLAMPSDMFNQDNRYNGVTFVNKGVVTNA